nr:TPA_asm: hypothetical protein HUJ06_004824 [Nelumbo nucifera]
MDVIHKFIHLVLPPVIVVTLCLILPFIFTMKLVFSLIMRPSPLSGENMSGKVVLITGGSSGIGEHLAYEYAKGGASLVLIARRENSLREVARKAVGLGSPDVLVVGADVSKVDECKQFVEAAVNHFGRLDHLVCNAGIISFCAFKDVTSIASCTSLMDINFWGSFYPTYFAVPHLKRSKGKIIVNASSSGWMGSPAMTFYGV